MYVVTIDSSCETDVSIRKLKKIKEDSLWYDKELDLYFDAPGVYFLNVNTEKFGLIDADFSFNPGIDIYFLVCQSKQSALLIQSAFTFGVLIEQWTNYETSLLN